MLTVTTTQRALLESQFQDVCVCVQIDTTSPLYLTTWSNAVAYGGETYVPSAMQISDVVFDSPRAASASFSIVDLDGVIRTAWYAEQFSQFSVYLYQLHLEDDGSWLATQSVTWKCSNCRAKRNGLFIVNLTSAGGLRQRAGLMTGSRELFPHAPIAGTPIKIGAIGITVPAGFRSPPPPPGGHDVPDIPETARQPGGRSSGEDPEPEGIGREDDMEREENVL